MWAAALSPGGTRVTVLTPPWGPQWREAGAAGLGQLLRRQVPCQRAQAFLPRKGRRGLRGAWRSLPGGVESRGAEAWRWLSRAGSLLGKRRQVSLKHCSGTGEALQPPRGVSSRASPVAAPRAGLLFLHAGGPGDTPRVFFSFFLLFLTQFEFFSPAHFLFYFYF